MNTCIDNELAECAYVFETGPTVIRNPYKYLSGYIPTVLQLGMDGIGYQVQSLLSQGHAYSIGQSVLAA